MPAALVQVMFEGDVHIEIDDYCGARFPRLCFQTVIRMAILIHHALLARL